MTPFQKAVLWGIIEKHGINALKNFVMEAEVKQNLMIEDIITDILNEEKARRE